MRIILVIYVLFSIRLYAQDNGSSQLQNELDFLKSYNELPFDSIIEDSVIRMIAAHAFNPTEIYRIQKGESKFSIVIKNGGESHFPEHAFNLNDKIGYELFKLVNSEFYNLAPTNNRFGVDGYTWTFEVKTNLGYHKIQRWAPTEESDPIIHALGDLIQQITYSTVGLTGTITDQNSHPIKKAKFQIDNPLILIKTNRHGEFKINFPLRLLTMDQLNIEITKKKYQTLNLTIPISELPTNLKVELSSSSAPP